jgi:hypothetical protein
MSSKTRIHLLGIPFLINNYYDNRNNIEKIKNFSLMMKSRNYEVYYYGIELLETFADKNINILSINDYNYFLYKSSRILKDDVEKITFWDNILLHEFNLKIKNKLIENYRDDKTDIICNQFEKIYDDLEFAFVEIGINYSNSKQKFRIFETHMCLSYTCGMQDKNPSNYWFVIPNSYNINDYKNDNDNPHKKIIGFANKITDEKQLLLMALSKKFPTLEIVIINDESKLGDYIAILCPNNDFSIKAQICGTPIIDFDNNEIIENLKTGFKCNTLNDFYEGIQLALDNKFNRSYIRDRAVELYDMYKIAYKYEYAFKCILDVYKSKGWFSNKSHIKLLDI